MTTLTCDKPAPPLEHVPLQARPAAQVGAAAGRSSSRGRSGLVGLLLGWGLAPIVIVPPLLYLVALPLWSRVVENRALASDRLVTALVWVALGARLRPARLAAVDRRRARALPVLDAKFFTWSMRNVIGEKGGIYHAIIGTLLITRVRRGDLGADRPADRDLPGGVRRPLPDGVLRSASSST